MITFTMDVKDFNRDIKKFQKKAGNISTERVIKKIAFDLLATMLGGLPGKPAFGLETLTKAGKVRKRKKYKQPKVTGRHPV